jgi:hypothetical protein
VVIGRSWWLILLVEGREGKGTGEQGVVVGRKMVITRERVFKRSVGALNHLDHEVRFSKNIL